MFGLILTFLLFLMFFAILPKSLATFLRSVFCTALILSTAAWGQSFQQFSPPNQGFKTGFAPVDIVAGDFNDDGKLDFITVDSEGVGITVFLNQGGAIFPDHGSAAYLAGQTPIAIAVGDFNNDGRLDLAVADHGIFDIGTQQWEGTGVSILIGNGDGTFRPAIFIPISGGEPNGITLTDYNGDNFMDLAVTSAGSNDITIIQNNGGTSFTIAKRFVPVPGLALGPITSAGFNQNGRIDLAFVTQQGMQGDLSFTGDGLYIAHNLGTGSYAVTQVMAIDHPGPINAVALNYDGFPDLLIQRAFPSAGQPHGVLALTNNRNGGFTQQIIPIVDNVTAGARAFAFDVDGDGILDIVTSFSGDGIPAGLFLVAGVALGKADGTYGPFVLYGGPNKGVAVGNFNGDGKNSFVGLSSVSEGFYVFLNTGPLSNCAAFSITGAFNLCSPANPDTSSPVRFIASATMPNGVDHIEVWDNGQKIDQIYGSHIDKSYAFTNGRHAVSLVAGEQTRAIFETLTTILQIAQPGGNGCPPSSTPNTVVICQPAVNSSVPSPVHVTATATGGSLAIVHMRVYVDNSSVFDSNATTLDTLLNMGAGQHTMVVVAWDTQGHAFTSSRTFTVTGSAGGSCGIPTTDRTINVCSPTAGSAVNSPVAISVRARWDCCAVTHMRIYVDNVDRFDTDFPVNNAIDTHLNVTLGTHNMVIVAWNNQGTFIQASTQFTID
jgi:hypothetical protein